MLQEFKPRKAEFGFKADEFSLDDLVATGRLVEALQTHYQLKTDYWIEFGVPFRARDIKFKVYTDNPVVAGFIRSTLLPTI